MNPPTLTSPTSPSTEFPSAQKAVLNSLIPEYEKYISENNPDHKPRSKELQEWRAKNAKALMKNPIIQDLVQSSTVSPLEWEMAIRRYFVNHYNNKLLPAVRRQIATPDKDKAVQDVLARAFVTFLGDISARELFANENEDAIQRKMRDIQAAHPDSELARSTLRNQALKVLWAKADKDLWQSKVDALANDVDANQAEFPGLMLKALQNLCNRDRLGSTVMSFSWAFRDTKTDEIRGGNIIAGYDAYEKKSISSKPADHSEQLEAWLGHADSVVPRKPRTSVYNIPVNKDGIPVFPQVEIMEMSPVKMAILLGDYLTSLWDFAQSGSKNRPIPVIPWDELSQNPDDYFDTAIYRLPRPLKAPELLKSDFVSAFSLYEYFSQKSTSQPFQFRSVDVASTDDDSNTSDHNEGDEIEPTFNPFSLLSVRLPIPILHPLHCTIAPSVGQKRKHTANADKSQGRPAKKSKTA